MFRADFFRLLTLAFRFLIAATLIWEPVRAFSVKRTKIAEEVVQFQLDALKKMNFAKAFAYNSPINQEVTGPWQTYATSLSEPSFRCVLGHAKASVQMRVTHEDSEYVCCLVKVVPGEDPLPETLTKLIAEKREVEQISIDGDDHYEDEDAEEMEDFVDDQKMKKSLPYSMYWWWVSKQYDDEDDDSSDYHYLVDTVMPDAEDMELDYMDGAIFQAMFEEGDDENGDDDSPPFFFDPDES